MSLERPGIIEVFKNRHGDRLTPFHIRVQLWMLLFGPAPIKIRLWNLFTKSLSPWHLRERAIEAMRGGLLAFAANLERMDVSLEELRIALRAKMQAEKREKGYHVGLIADGNRRYGVMMGQSKSWGHIQGAKAIQNTFLPLITQIPEISECSLYLLSHDNLYNRPEDERRKLDQLFAHEKENLLKLAEKHNIRYHHAGDMQELQDRMPGMAQGLTELVNKTKGKDGLVVNLCINYQAKTEVGQAAKQWATQKIREGATEEEILVLDNTKVCGELLKEAWIQEKMDLCIRTGGDYRGSGFPINQAWNENCHLSVVKKFLPQIAAQDVVQILYEFSGAERRMGR